MRDYPKTFDIKNTKENRKAIGRSSISRRFGVEMGKAMMKFLDRPINTTYPILMMDGLGVGEYMVIVALGIDADGHKHMLGMVEGSTENHIVCKTLLSDMIARDLATDEKRLFVLDGGKGCTRGKDTFGDNAVIQRCQVHKKRNVEAHLPNSEQSNIAFG